MLNEEKGEDANHQEDLLLLLLLVPTNVEELSRGVSVVEPS